MEQVASPCLMKVMKKRNHYRIDFLVLVESEMKKKKV
jgi:hypothetical protein